MCPLPPKVEAFGVSSSEISVLHRVLCFQAYISIHIDPFDSLFLLCFFINISCMPIEATSLC